MTRQARSAQTKSKLPRRVERMIADYVGLVLTGQTELAKDSARVGLRMLVEKAIEAAR
jgi:hypothetical protein